MEFKRIINCNTPAAHCSLDAVQSSQCSKLAPNKNTFLKSNQLITKYVMKGNVEENSAATHSKSLVYSASAANAYVSLYAIRQGHELPRSPQSRIETKVEGSPAN